jgi:hypothetical protein
VTAPARKPMIVPFREPVDTGHGTQQINFPDSNGAHVFVGATTPQDDEILVVIGKLADETGQFAGYSSNVLLSRDDARAFGQFLIDQAG